VADGTPIPVMAKTNLFMNINGLKLNQQVKMVTKLNHAMIIGCDFFYRTHAVLDFGKRLVSFADADVEVPIHTANRETQSVRTKFAITIGSICIPAYSEALCLSLDVIIISLFWLNRFLPFSFDIRVRRTSPSNSPFVFSQFFGGRS